MREPTLSAYPYSTIELACRYCDRRGRYRRDRVILKHGGGMTLDQFVRMVSADCGFSQKSARGGNAARGHMSSHPRHERRRCRVIAH